MFPLSLGTPKLVSLSFALTLLSALQISGAAVFAEDNASLDSMWIDQEAPLLDNEPSRPNKESSSKSPAPAVATTSGLPATIAPMCGFDEFRASPLVAKQLWPGLGPFSSSASDISELNDKEENRLKLNVNSDQVTSAQLQIGKLGKGHVKDFLDIQMASDFLLESLGAKPRKIIEFNQELEKNKAALKPGARGLALKAGRYQVTIDRSKNAQPYSCLIAVNSLDANKSILAEHSVNPDDEKPDENKAEKRPIMDVINAAIKKPAAAKPKIQVAAMSPSVDPRREELESAIKGWQQVKKKALKTRDASELAQVLSGVALSKQNTAVKWLQTHGNYYEMEPRGCTVEKYTDLGGAKKYSVVAVVREFSKYLRESDKAVLKEVDDKYTVNYTLEKISDKWFIVDSAVLNSAQNSKPAPTKR